MESIVRKVKNLKTEAYNEFTGNSILEQLGQCEDAVEQDIFKALEILDKQTVSDATFAADVTGTKNAEGFVFQFVHKILEKRPESYKLLAEFMKSTIRQLTFPRVCVSILLMQNLTPKVGEAEFIAATRELSILIDTFYRTLFEVILHGSKDLTESEQQVVLKTGYLKVSGAIKTFIKANKKLLDPPSGRLVPSRVDDYLSFDGEVVERKNPSNKVYPANQEFFRLTGNLLARLDFIRFHVENKDTHELLQFRDIREAIKPLEEKLTHDPLGVLEAESGYFQYRKYHVLSLRKDKVFNLHKNIVVNTDQLDEHILPANEPWEGHGGLFANYLVKNYLIKDRSLWAMLSPSKLAKLILHAFNSTPENTYTGGDYYLEGLYFLQKRLQSIGVGALDNQNQDNLFWYDTFVALKRIDFNLKPKHRKQFEEFFAFLFGRITHRHTRFLLCSKFLDMDYQETFFQTAGMTTSVLQIIHHEMTEAKYNAFTEPELFLRKELLEKCWGHISKADHKQLGNLRHGLWLFMQCLHMLHQFNASDWLAANTLREFYNSFDVTALDALKEKFQTRLTECKEIVDRKNKGLFTGELARVVDQEFVENVKAEAVDLRFLTRRVEDIKLEMSEK